MVTYAGVTYDFVNGPSYINIGSVANPNYLEAFPANAPSIFGSVPCVSGATGGAATFDLLTSCSGQWGGGDSQFGFIAVSPTMTVYGLRDYYVFTAAVSPVNSGPSEMGTYTVSTPVSGTPEPSSFALIGAAMIFAAALLWFKRLSG